MIKKLKAKNVFDIIDFLETVDDKYQEIYITLNKERIFLKGNINLIKKILKYQEVYGIFENRLKAIMIIYREKNFRPYVKLLSESSKISIDFLKFLKWNFFEKDLYFKLKKENPLSEQIRRTGFIMVGDRGKELLFFKRGMKQLYKITPKDFYLEDNSKRLY